MKTKYPYRVLGQVFTRPHIANQMVAQIQHLPRTALILEPCYGNGVFLDCLKNAGFKNVDGCELDNNIAEQSKKRHSSYTLFTCDFLQYKPQHKYDAIVMNPPYIRHENINDLERHGITKDIIRKNSLYSQLPRTANLYMYFIVHAIELLKISGELVVIFPASWLTSATGIIFSEILKTTCQIKQENYVREDAFEGSPLVDVLILHLIKRSEINKTQLPIKNTPTDLNSNYVSTEFETSFTDIATVKRGITTGANEIFVNPQLPALVEKNYTKPLLSSPKNIAGYSTYGAILDKLLVIEDASSIQLSDQIHTDYLSLFNYEENATNKLLCAYLNEWSEYIIKNKKPLTLYNKIKEKKTWFCQKQQNGKGILFSYFIRDNMKFIHNPYDISIRDNFYVIQSKIEYWLLFALLNNFYTYYQLERIGRIYGAGLLKIQKYDIEALKFPNPEGIDEKHKLQLIQLSQNLSKTGNQQIIENITEIISEYVTLKTHDIKKLLFLHKKNRLFV